MEFTFSKSQISDLKFNNFLTFLGYGKDIDWMTLEAGLKEAKEKSKPIFLLIHKTWCGACRSKNVL